jgi:hypothetical protein
MVYDGIHLGTKKDKKFTCKLCDFESSHLGKWKRHVETKKHKTRQMVYDGMCFGTKRTESSDSAFACSCGKTYRHQSGYYRHRKNCTENQSTGEDQALSKGDVIDILKAVVPSMLDAAGSGNRVVCNGSNNNINSQEVKINLYLNERCSDAMSIQGFTQRLSMTVADLLKDGKPIARDGVSNIFIDNLRPLAMEARPIHCVDADERSWHVKDDVAGWTSGKEAASGALMAANFQVGKSLGRLWDASFPGWEQDGQRVEQFHGLCQMLMGDPTSSEVEAALESIGPECNLSVEEVEKLAFRHGRG